MSSERLTVAIASFRSVELIESCLVSIVPQARTRGAKVVVARAGSVETERPGLESRWPAVEFVWLNPGTELPRIRGAAISRGGDSWVALTEDHCVADPGWLEALMAAAPSGQVIGGVMDTAKTERGIDLGAFFAEYGFFARGAAASNSTLITGANVLYHPALAPEVARWMEEGYWENVVHDRLRQRGVPFGRAVGAVILQNLTYAVGPFCRDRYQHGLAYARTRLQERGASGLSRVMLGLAAVVLPIVLLARVGRAADPRALGRFLRAAPWTLLFLTAWSLGEMSGYLAGSPTGDQSTPGRTP